MRPDLLAITVLASLEGMGPRRLAAVVAAHGPVEALTRLRAGRSLDVALDAGLVRSWRTEAATLDDATIAGAVAAGAMTVSRPGDPEHPVALVTDIDPAPVLFRRGLPFTESIPRVAIVGTRRCTGLGRDVARELGHGLAEAGVSVVSGLALGIDGAAHHGVLQAHGAPPIAVVGGGADVVYPKRHHQLWASLEAAGTIASEAPPGAAPTRWRFPARNRLIAALSDIVVVVESRRAGGSMLTVDEAIRRDRQVMAVPGSVRNPAAVGTNGLLADGCAPVTSVDDVVVALGLGAVHRRSTGSARPEPAGAEVPEHLADVFDAVDDGATTIDTIIGRVGRPAAVVLAAVGELAGRGLVVDDGADVRRA
ncbi:MAG: DNA-processing protein DprA [Actinomycetota bacterium]